MQIASISGANLSRWQDVASHHRNDIRLPATYCPLQDLPTGLHVVLIHLAFEEDSLFIIQLNKMCNPLGVKLLLDWFNWREGEDELFTLKVALDELQAIVSKSNAATQRARHVTGRQDKISWWQERKDLDTRMRNLVERIESDWLGACKTLDFKPACALWSKVFDDGAKERFVKNVSGHLGNVSLDRIKTDQVAIFLAVNKDLGNRVAKAISLKDTPEPYKPEPAAQATK
ncbi:extra spindle pole bodies 1 [Puccinia graminis f. sp. tritici]|uniref:Extra spindle pole bodies 1 n=1 Tax=Puccinia graminis f. sp. tritici TaxID=56615 RepID=A0A5B0SF82_PUCGR|nr:extra spindle pole bodies 1 [Puccinia graminis f. sp. tritici]KAA1136145.1 extra spindle pole bodies 1 [Puccinia graminis f. sp. tritici]